MLISVIIPFYKGNKYLDRILECLQKNAKKFKSYGSLEVIIINDSPDYLLKYNKEIVVDFVVDIYTNIKNFGIHKSRVNGLNKAKGEYVLFLDQDDEIAENFICSQFSKIGAFDVIVSNGFIEKNKLREKIFKHKYAHYSTRNIFIYLYNGCQIVSPGQCLIKKNSIPIIWYQEILNINGADDFYLWILFLINKVKIIYNPELLYVHIDTGKNLSSNANEMRKSEREVYGILKRKKVVSEKQLDILNRRLLWQEGIKKFKFHNKIKLLLKNIDVAFFYLSMRLFKMR